jgi:ammonia channel protein AmtB
MLKCPLLPTLGQVRHRCQPAALKMAWHSHILIMTARVYPAGYNTQNKPYFFTFDQIFTWITPTIRITVAEERIYLLAVLLIAPTAGRLYC